MRDPEKIVYPQRFVTDFGTILVTRSQRDGILRYQQNGTFHSQTTADGTSICAYIHLIHQLVRQAQAWHVLVLGCAGGSLPTMLRRLNRRVTVVDINPAAFTIARQFFQLPSTVRCIRSEGLRFLRTTGLRFDAVVVDVFGAANTVPPGFATRRFFRLISRVLIPHGMMIMNTISAHDEDRRVRRIVDAANTVFSIDLFDWPDKAMRNTLLVSGMRPQFRIPSGHEPDIVKTDFDGLVRRKPKLPR